MDPLSATASAIALLQAATAIGKGIQTIRSLGRAPAELCALLNELTTLQALTSRFEDDLNTLKSSDNASSLNKGSDSIEALENIHQELSSTIDQLSSLVQRFAKNSKGRNKDGQHRIPRLRWHLERENINQLRTSAQQSRDYLTAFMTSIQVSNRCVRPVPNSANMHCPSCQLTHLTALNSLI